jgi:transcriptional regulator with XRE-family HTH domain
MTYRTTFASGRHLAAARTLAGLKQTELAKLAGLHVNSLKRLERMVKISRHCGYSLERLEKALAAKGIEAECSPDVSLKCAPGTITAPVRAGAREAGSQIEGGY